MLKRVSTYLAGLLMGLLLAALLLLLISEPRGIPIQLLPPPTPSHLRIHVTGEVVNPGVYSLFPGSIVQQALEASGGCTEDANLEGLNLAAPIQDGQQIVIPRVGQPTAASAWPGTPTPHATRAGKINVNTASATELELLPGIGPSIAQSIIECRERQGPFAKPEDLPRVSGIGPAKLEAIRELITYR